MFSVKDSEERKIQRNIKEKKIQKGEKKRFDDNHYNLTYRFLKEIGSFAKRIKKINNIKKIL